MLVHDFLHTVRKVSKYKIITLEVSGEGTVMFYLHKRLIFSVFWDTIWFAGLDGCKRFLTAQKFIDEKLKQNTIPKMCSEGISYTEKSILGIDVWRFNCGWQVKKSVKNVKVKKYWEQLSAVQVVISEIGRRKSSKIKTMHFSMTDSLKLLELVSKILLEASQRH